MKKKLFDIIKFLFARLFGLNIELSRSRVPILNIKNPFEVTYIQPIDLSLYLDKRESLDQSYAQGVVDEPVLNFLNKNMGSANWFIDIGANQGMFSCYVLKNFPT